MPPHIGKLAFMLGMLILVFTLIPLPFLKRDSAEFTVDIMAIIVDCSFLGFVTWSVRRQVRGLKEKLRERTPGEPSVGGGTSYEIDQDGRNVSDSGEDKDSLYGKEGNVGD